MKYAWTMMKQTRIKRESEPVEQVFLGGSCNPTTWRQDIAMPLLDKNAVHYYNPQAPFHRPGGWWRGLADRGSNVVVLIG